MRSINNTALVADSIGGILNRQTWWYQLSQKEPNQVRAASAVYLFANNDERRIESRRLPGSVDLIVICDCDAVQPACPCPLNQHRRRKSGIPRMAGVSVQIGFNAIHGLVSGRASVWGTSHRGRL
jgi:hypothetical protein